MQIAYRYRLSSRLTPRGIAAYTPKLIKISLKQHGVAYRSPLWFIFARLSVKLRLPLKYSKVISDSSVRAESHKTSIANHFGIDIVFREAIRRSES